MTDAAQRTDPVLGRDAPAQRQYYEQKSKAVPHVLSFEANWCSTGAPSPGRSTICWCASSRRRRVVLDPLKRPFVVVDPRAGHGPGIGGFKADSEIGVAMNAGHPCYFVGFTPDPMPGQTIEDVCAPRRRSSSEVIALHPEAEGKPCVIGNCQAGWPIMMTAASPARAVRPDHRRRLAAVLLGRRARRESRCATPAACWRQLADGAGQRPGQRHVRRRPPGREFREPESRQHALDQEATTSGRRSTPRRTRFLEFENWWGGPVNAQRRGNAVDRRQAVRRQQARHRRDRHPEGERVDLRNIRSPIICFCSMGRQHHAAAAGAGLDHRSLRQRRRHRRLRPDHRLHAAPDDRPSRHLRLGRVATKEHDEFASYIDLIDVLPPGLYEAVITEDRRWHRPPRADPRQVSAVAAGAHAGRHPRAGRQQRGGRPPASPRWRASPRSIAASIAPSPSP